MTDAPDILLEFQRNDRKALEAELLAAGAVLKGTAIKCPFHDDQHPSGSVYEKDGVWRFKCHGCGVCEDIIGVKALAAGRKSADVLRDARQDQKRPEPKKPPRIFPTVEALKKSVANLEACYVYADPATKAPQMIVLRYLEGGRKKFIQASPSGSGFAMTAPPKPWPIYNRARVIGAANVFVVEGEKCCHALHDIGIVATTNPGGAGKAELADWSPLAGKTVYLWPDNDPAENGAEAKGAAHMRQVQKELEKLQPAPVVHWIEPGPFDLPPKGDVVEYLELYGNGSRDGKRTAIDCAVQTAKPVGGASELRQRITKAKAGELKSVSWPWGQLTRLSKALFPGTVTAICADPGSGKSFLALEAFAHWHRKGIKAAAHMLEDTKGYHLNRMLAQLERYADIADTDWQERHPAEIDAAELAHRTDLDAMAPWLDATDEPVTYDALLEWMRRRCAQHARVLLIDPITAVPVDDKPWLRDREFIMAAKQIVSQWGASLVLMTHPRGGKGNGKGTLSDIAGGAAFPRFSHNVFWIDKFEEPKQVLCAGPRGDFRATINRQIRMSKTRNGKGGGLAIGFHFGDGLLFAEQGVVLKPKKGQQLEQTNDPFSSTEAA